MSIMSVISFCLCFFWAVGAIAAGNFELDVHSSLYPVPRCIQYSFTLQNFDNHLVKNVEFRTYVPAKQTSTQLSVSLKASHDYELITGRLGNQILEFTFDKFPPCSAKVIEIRADLLLSDTQK